MSDQQSTGALKGVRKLPDYLNGREHVFKSQQSLAWFVRCNRAALIRAGALVMLAGQWYVRDELFDQFVLNAGTQQAMRHAVAA